MKFLLPLLIATKVSAFMPASHSIRQHKALFSDATVETPPSTPPPTPPPTPPSESTSLSDLKSFASELNPIVNYYDPLNLVDFDFWYQGQDAAIGFLRHAEIKHGRVAMAAFVGYCIQSNWHFPWAMTREGAPFPSIDLSPEQQWDAIPAAAKWQILLVIGALEFWGEATGRMEGEQPHYMKGGQPGKYPSFKLFRDEVHFVLDLYDPFGFNKKMSDEKKERRLVMEVNNGRLAMLGIFGFLSADTIEGSVPLLKNIAIPYDGQVMSPFEAGY